jgi:hypothetical protein
MVLPDGKEAVFEPALLETWGEAGEMPEMLRRPDSRFHQVHRPAQFEGYRDRGEALAGICAGNTAWAALMDSDWLQDQNKTRGELRAREDDQKVVLTASPAELRQ